MKKRFMKMILVVALLSLSLMLGGCDGKELLPTTTAVPVNGNVVDPLATPAPTEEPTEAPKATEVPKATEAPAVTEAPTLAPVATEIPEETKEPEVVATEAPTAEPTVEPTAEPTEAPKATEKPKATPKPTEAPTAKPTVKPTEAPKPTAAPTAKPTEAPKPTQAPAPTAVPATPAPTAAPTQAPVAHTHSWDSGTVIANAQCGNDGTRQYKCSCGEVKNEAIPATGAHSWYESYYQYPTCKKGGLSTMVCSTCGVHGESISYDTLPHDYESTLSWEGDCSHPSSYKNVCKNCGWEGEKTYGDLNPNVHNWRTTTEEEWDEQNYKWVTYTATWCSYCGLTKEITYH